MNEILPIAGQMEKTAVCQMMADRIPGVVWSTDASMRFTASFGAGLAALNLRPNEVIGKSLFEYFHASDENAAIVQAHCRAMAGEPVDFEFLHQGRNYLVHIERFLDDLQGPAGCIGFAQDITDRKRVEREFRSSEEKYRRLYESMQDAFVSVDMEGRIQEFNEPYREMLGYDAEELRKLTYVELTPANWHAFERKIVEQQILQRRYSDTYEKEYRKKDGTVFPVELRTFLITDDAGQAVGMWAIVRDITQRKRSQDEDKRIRVKLEERVEDRTLELTRANWALKREIRERMKAEADLQQKHAAIRRMLQASDRERQDITKGIHDKVVQVLLAGGFQLEGYKKLADRNSQAANDALAAAMKTIRQASEAAVVMCNLMLTPVLDDYGVSAAIADFIDHLGDPPAVPEIMYACDSRFDRLIPILEHALFRVAQEAISNACRHSHSEMVRVTLSPLGEEVILEVEDWGRGFDPSEVAESGFGLNEIREFARVFGKGLQLDTERDRGTRIRAAFPLIYRDAD